MNVGYIDISLADDVQTLQRVVVREHAGQLLHEDAGHLVGHKNTKNNTATTTTTTTTTTTAATATTTNHHHHNNI